jgi:hypothetical protein
VYNRRGDIVDTIGSIKGRRNAGFTNDYYYGPTTNQTDYAYNNDDYYYYKSDGTKAKVEDKK